MMPTHESTAAPALDDPFPDDLECRARAVLALRVGRALTDREWAQAAARLRAFVNILRPWDRAVTTIEARLDNVVPMRKVDPR